MRVDLYLKTICLMKRRSEAKRACDNGIVSIGGVQAKAARDRRLGWNAEGYAVLSASGTLAAVAATVIPGAGSTRRT